MINLISDSLCGIFAILNGILKSKFIVRHFIEIKNYWMCGEISLLVSFEGEKLSSKKLFEFFRACEAVM